MTDTEKLLAERATTHGEYSEHARITQGIMDLIMGGRNWGRLTPIQRESLHMFAHKIGRICEGDPNHRDHWDDISGYAVLVSQRLGYQDRIIIIDDPGYDPNADKSLWDPKKPVPVHAVGDPDPAKRGGANGMKYGDRIIYQPSKMTPGRVGIAGEFTQDGDVTVTFDDGQIETVKWARCYPARSPDPVPVEDSNRHADRSGYMDGYRIGINSFEYMALSAPERTFYEWDEDRQEYRLRTTV